jgi:hypothetical protein
MLWIAALRGIAMAVDDDEVTRKQLTAVLLAMQLLVRDAPDEKRRRIAILGLASLRRLTGALLGTSQAPSGSTAST